MSNKLLSMLLMAGCAVEPEVGESIPTAAAVADADQGAGPEWMALISERIRNENHAFRADGDAWHAEVPERDLEARFSASDVTFSTLGEPLATVRRIGYGRTEAAAIPLGDPLLGDCDGDRMGIEGQCLRRLEFAGPDGLTEWWSAAEDGFEQGFVVDSPIPGHGELVFEFEVDGADFRMVDDHSVLVSEHGEQLTVSKLRAWDADGEALSAWMEPSDHGFRIVVDDRGARYPIEIDPLYSTSWSLSGTNGTAQMGLFVAGGSDVDGDGYDDIMASGYFSGVGEVYVFRGSASIVSDETAYRVSLGATVTCVAAGFDANNDGYGDIIAGVSGTAYVFYGSASGLSDASKTTLTAASAYTWFGESCDAAGDVNGDGYDDVVVGARGTTYNPGYALIFHGSASGVSTTASRTLSGATSGDQFGTAVSGAADVNNDGYDDLIVGAPSYGSSDGGAFYVYLGSSSGIGTSASTTVTGATTKGYLGQLVSEAGDVDADGYDDVVVDEWGTAKGYVYHGSATGTSTSSTTTLTSTYAVANAGDVNADGFDDVVVGNFSTEAVFLHYGSFAGLYPTASASWSGSAYTGGSGYSTALGVSVAAAGDVDGDGIDDFVAGGYGAYAGLGVALVMEGDTSGAALSSVIAGVSDDKLGASMASAGDVNGDGYGDLIVGAPAYYNYKGRAYLFEGSESGPSTTPSTTLTGSAISEQFGSTVAGAGDVDNDGYDDVIIGSWYVDKSYVFLGDASGLSSTASTTLGMGELVGAAGDVNNDGYDDVLVHDGSSTVRIHHGSSSGVATTATTSWSVSSAASALGSAGDTNGDGYGDVFVAQTAYSSSTGRVIVYRGSATTVSTSTAVTLSGFGSGELFGASVAAPDVNGDGYDDIVVGASGYSGGTGRIYVYHSASTGLSTTLKALIAGSAGDAQGAGLASIGDRDGDGYEDIAALASGAAEAAVYEGSSSGLGTTSIETWTADATNMVSAGDVNGDGAVDLLFADPAADGNAGVVFVHVAYLDADGDGYATGTDCDDTDPAITGPYTAYADADGDGYGDPSKTASVCAATSGYVTDDTDCNDASATAHPGGTEVCDTSNVDEDCDGTADDADSGASGKTTMYADGDLDGYGNASSPVAACDTSAGVVSDGTDCNDANASIHPGATEVCDASDVDEDCDGKADDADSGATGTTTAYVDADGDGYGASTMSFCDVPATGYSTSGGDCDDTSSSVSPAGAEVCDAADADEDCDGKADNADSSATGKSTFYLDSDRDGYGGSTTASYCDAASGYVATSTDCDDGLASVSPGGTEVCDAANRDEDCDGLRDDADPSATGQSTFYADADGDGFGGSVTGAYCDAATGYVSTSTDCDDTDATVHPAASEVCDGADRDEDCDGKADDADSGASGTTSFYVDADGDGFGSATTTHHCDPGAGYVSSSSDCDDGAASSYPGAAEVTGDGVDQDCDGGEVCFVDADGDGLRGVGTVSSSDADCSDAGEIGVAAVADCDDSSASVGAGAAEIVGNGIDEDCDGHELCYVDADDDGYFVDADMTSNSADLDCEDPGEADDSALEGDCDDEDPAFNPTAEEGNCVDPNDYNCDGSTGYVDADGDGYAACEECDDSRTGVHPGATEVCNGRDDDCDGEVDVGATDATTWYADADGDGYVDLEASVLACDPPDGYAAATETDCEDSDPSQYPGAEEVAGDGIDQDCDGADLEDTGAPGDTDIVDTDGGGDGSNKCGCSSSTGAGGPALVLGALLLWTRGTRRRRAA